MQIHCVGKMKDFDVKVGGNHLSARRLTSEPDCYEWSCLLCGCFNLFARWVGDWVVPRAAQECSSQVWDGIHLHCVELVWIQATALLQ